MRLPIVDVGILNPAGSAVCVQPNGERLPVENWVLRAYQNDNLDDPMLRRIIENAVRIEVNAQ